MTESAFFPNAAVGAGLDLPLGDLVEAFEQQLANSERADLLFPLDFASPDWTPALAHDLSMARAEEVLAGSDQHDLVIPDDPDSLPDDQIEHASDGAGFAMDDPGGLNDAWNRLF